MTPSRCLIAALCAFGIAATTPVAASAATTSASATLTLSASGKRALKASSLKLTAKRTFPVGDWSVGSSAKVALDGKLRFTSGKRRVDATRLQVTLGRSSSYVSTRLGRRTVKLLTVQPTRPAVLDADAGRASVNGARVALTRAAARRLKSALKLRRTPTTRTLGTLTLAVEAPPAPAPAPAPAPLPAPPAPVPTPSPSPTPEPTPDANPCGFAATPAGNVDWFGCALPGSSDLRSWVDYVQRDFAPIPPCLAGPSAITASDGATRLVAATAYDHRLPVTSSTLRPDGSATVKLAGTITYSMSAHGIDEAITSLEIEIAPGGRSGTVYASGRAAPRDMGAPCTQPNVDYTREAVLTLDLSATEPVTSGGVTRWVNVPAKVVKDSPWIGGGGYSERPWGSFTIAVGA